MYQLPGTPPPLDLELYSRVSQKAIRRRVQAKTNRSHGLALSAGRRPRQAMTYQVPKNAWVTIEILNSRLGLYRLLRFSLFAVRVRGKRFSLVMNFVLDRYRVRGGIKRRNLYSSSFARFACTFRKHVR